MQKTPAVSFIKTALYPKDYPVVRDPQGNILPEIAVVGRSNVGKSSLLNHFFQTKKLVKTSCTPGKTQALNFFNYHNEWVFADLPGYGYASVPLAVKKQWGPLMRTYLEKRDSLQLILFLLDIRRVPSQEDLQFLSWAQYHGKPIIFVLTKADKVNQSEKQANKRKIIEALGVTNPDCITYSVPKNLGSRELLKQIRSYTQVKSKSDIEEEECQP